MRSNRRVEMEINATLLGSMTGWVGFAFTNQDFNVLPGRPAATERGGHGTRDGWRDKIKADNCFAIQFRAICRG